MHFLANENKDKTITRGKHRAGKHRAGKHRSYLYNNVHAII